VLHLEHSLNGAETWTLRAVNQKHLESFEMWRWRRMEKISWTDHVRNEDVLFRVKEQRNILHEISKRKANWTGHILHRNCLLQRVTEGKIKREEGPGIDPRSLQIFSGASDSSMCPGVDSASKNKYEDIPGVKDGRCVRVTTLPPSCAECLEILEP